MTKRTDADIARLYHLHSSFDKARSLDPDVDFDRTPARFRTYPGAARTALPGRDFAVEMSLGTALERRRSIREYALGPLPLEVLGRLLHTSYGVRGLREMDGEWSFHRPAPSAGARYPLELYVATQAVESLADGIYHYDARGHALELMRPGLAQPALMDLTLGQEMVRDTNLVIVVTAIRDRTLWKYGQRGYRHVLLDAGHVGENLYLVATALGLGPTGIGGFYDAELAALLKLPEDEEPFYVLCIGQPAPAARPTE
ncbi:TOMM biosynthesis dehydrogenase protein B [Minicystis rosea]|nr:TOMM biosynthesis dehydrogenase protein B [Minicystis rosea]